MSQSLEDELQALFDKRREIDRALLERHATEMAVLFTDIVGSTAYFEQRGDIEGLALVRRHNDLLFPVVKLHGGRVVKTIGDSIMAVFPAAREGVACAVAMQETLAKETGTPSQEKIRVRVGVHFGRVLKDGDDVFGDTVNTAARVQSSADGEEIVLSQACVDALPAGHPWMTAPRPALAAKGKSAPVAVATLAWRDEDKRDAQALSPAARELFLLEVGRGPDGLRVTAMDGEAERGTVKAYADVAIGTDEIDRLAEPFAVLAHDGGQAAYAQALVDKGKALFQKVLPERVRTRLLETQRHTIRLHLEDTLVHAPWELLHDGRDFLGCRFSMGRMVSARADAAVPPPSTTAQEIVIVANPSGDLPHAEEEGRVVERLFSSSVPGRVVHTNGPLSRADFLGLVVRARILHFAGHVVRGQGEGGFVLADGVVTPSDLQVALGQSAPLLVFANACHASTSERWQERGASSLAQALLLAGVRHTLAPMWSVPDADALSFALRFYEAALTGVPFGECARRARKTLAATFTAPLSFAGYVLYGDPRATLPPEDATLQARGRTRSGDFPPVDVAAKTAQRTPSRVSPASSASVTPSPATPLATGGLPAQPGGISIVAMGGAGGLLVGVIVIAALALRSGAAEDPKPVVVVAPPAPALPEAPPAPAKVVHSGPLRVSVMPFHSTGAADTSLDYLRQGLPEVIVTALVEANAGGVQIIERGQIDVDIGELEFSQSRYVDPATRAALGKIGGAEVGVLGGYQLAGEALRFTARFIDIETGEVLAAAKADGRKSDVFGLQDRLADDVKKAVADVKKRMRP